MATGRFEPTATWLHALTRPDCTHHLLLVASDLGRLVGWCRLFPEGTPPEQDLVLGIGLSVPYRDRGIGTRLVCRSLHWAAASGYQSVRLVTAKQNERAVHVFSRCGFSVKRRLDGNMLEMVRDLVPSGP